MPNPNYIFANTINGNPLYADRAEHDADGNLISTTYATKAELPEGVPTVTSSDDGKVLTADYTGGVASYSWETPSSGSSDVYWAEVYVTTISDIWTAVIAGKTVYARNQGDVPPNPSNSTHSIYRLTYIYYNSNDISSSYAYFERMYITSDPTISVYGFKVGGDGSWNDYGFSGVLTPSSAGASNGDVLTTDGYGSMFWAAPAGGGSRIVELTVGTSTWSDFTTAYAQLTAGTIDAIRAKASASPYGYYYADLVYVVTGPMGGSVTNAYFSLPSYRVSNSSSSGTHARSKVYELNAGGWTTTNADALASNIVAGTGISVTTDASYNIEVALSTTAGITDIQQVASLPANPVSTVLYLIPES